MTLRITTKVKAKIHLTAFDESPRTEPPQFLQEWYVNHITLGKKRFFIFSEATTLFSHVVSSNQINGRKRLEELATDILFHHFKRHSEISQELFETIADRFYLCKTENRRILGSQNDLVRMAESVVSYHGDENFDRINDTPLSMLEYSPRSAFADELKKLK